MLRFDESGSDDAPQLDVHSSSTGDGADRVPAHACGSFLAGVSP